MNKLLNVVSIDIKLLLKSKVFYLKLILFPVALILILGNLLGNSDTQLTRFTVAFYSEDSTVTLDSNQVNLGDSLYENVLTSQSSNDLFEVTKVSSLSEGKNLVEQKDAAVLIYVPADFTQAYVNDTSASIQLIADNSKLTDKAIVQSILNRYEQSLTTLRIEQNAVINNSLRSIDPQKLQTLLQTINNAQDSSQELALISTGTSQKPLNIMQYESIAMIVMFSILTAFELAHGMVEEKLNHTQMRIQSTPTRYIQYALGKVCSIILAIVVQMSIVMMISHFVFQIDFGNVLLILLTTVSYGFALGCIVFCAGIAAKDQMSISSFSSLILYGFSFLGGSFMSKDSFPNSLQKIQQIIPNGKAINCYLKIYQGETISSIGGDLVALLGIGLIFLVIALYLFSERRSFNHANFNHDKKPAKTSGY